MLIHSINSSQDISYSFYYCAYSNESKFIENFMHHCKTSYPFLNTRKKEKERIALGDFYHVVTRFRTIDCFRREKRGYVVEWYIHFFFSRDHAYDAPRTEYFMERPSSLTRPRFTSWPAGKLPGEDNTRGGESARCLSHRPENSRDIHKRIRFIERRSGKMVSRESVKHLGAKFPTSFSIGPYYCHYCPEGFPMVD